MTIGWSALHVLATASILAAPLRAGTAPSPIDPGLAPERIATLTEQAFYWGINLAGFYELRYLYTQLEGHPAFRGINRMQPQKKLFDASVRIATTLNASTLYSGGAFDVSREPVVIETAAVSDGRYWSVQAADQNIVSFFRAGSQFTGNGAQRYLVVGPAWRGRLPAQFRSTEIVRASSDSFSIAVRVAVTKRADSAKELATLEALAPLIDGSYAMPAIQRVDDAD